MADNARISGSQLVMTLENFSQAMDWIADSLAGEKVEQHEIYIMQLLVEETFLRLAKHSNKQEDFCVNLSWHSKFKRLSLVMSAKGEAYNPLLVLPEDTEDELSGYAILSSHRKRLKYTRRRRDGMNNVTILLHEPGNQEVRNILTGLVLGAAMGIFLHYSAGAQTKIWLEDGVIEPIQSMFISALMMAIAPMIFFSVISGISSMSYSSNIGRIGWRVVFWSLGKLAFYVTIGMLAGYLVGGMTDILPALVVGGQAAVDSSLTLRSLITGIVPGNVISPFANNNIMQTLFLACFCGFILNKMEGPLEWAREGVNFMNRFTMNVVQMVTMLLPFLVCISMARMVMKMGLGVLLTYGKLLLVIALGMPLCFIVSSVLIGVIARLSPVIFLQKTVRFSALPFSTCNSSACLPATLQFCEEKLGISERLTKFSVPVGMQFNMDGIAYYVSVVSMMLACTFSVTIDADFLFSLFCVEFLMAMTGVGLIVMPPVLESMGIPGTAVMHFIGLEPLMDMPGTAQNVVGNITSALLVAKQEGQVDEKVYNSL